MGRYFCKVVRHNNLASIGVSGLIIFIVIVLITGLTASFNNIAENTDVWSRAVPEVGHLGVINIRTTYTFVDNVTELQWNM